MTIAYNMTSIELYKTMNTQPISFIALTIIVASIVGIILLVNGFKKEKKNGVGW